MNAFPSETTWEDFAPSYRRLLAEPLQPQTAADWLARWSDAEKAVWEARAWLKRARSRDERDPAARERFQRFMTEVFPPFRSASQALIEKLLALPDYHPLPQHARFIASWRADAALYREENVALEAEIAALMERFDAIVWSRTIDLAGEQLSPSQAKMLARTGDSRQREALWDAQHNVWHEQSADLSDLFLDLVRRRHAIACNAGFADYRTYRWQELHRFDFSSDDVIRCYESLVIAFAPGVEQLVARRRQLSGIGALKPWDWEMEISAESKQHIFATDEALLDAIAGICTSLDPEFGTLVTRMRQHAFIDVGTRPGKASGGEEWYFPVTDLPAIRVETAGTLGDLLLALHECGHAWHDHLSLAQQGLLWNMGGPSGFEEFPSTSLPFLALSLCGDAMLGFASQDLIDAMLMRELDRVLVRWLPDIIRTELFQHWVYAQAPDALRPGDLEAKWLECTQRCFPWIDWTGYERDVAIDWQRSGLIFDKPFYYTEYGLAQIGALQMLQRAVQDSQPVWRGFKAALMAGNSRSLPDLSALLGISSPFAPDAIDEIAAFIDGLIRRISLRLLMIRAILRHNML